MTAAALSRRFGRACLAGVAAFVATILVGRLARLVASLAASLSADQAISLALFSACLVLWVRWATRTVR